MIRQRITSIKEGKRYQAVEVLRNDAEEKGIFISIQKKKNTLEVVECTEIQPLKSLSEKIKKHSLLFVIINTPQVLTKVVPTTKGEDLAMVNKAFPNIKTEDFYYEGTTSGKHDLVTLCRKEHADALLEKMKAYGMPISGYTLGISQITTLLPYISSDSITVSNATIRINKMQIEAFDKPTTIRPETYAVNGIPLKSTALLGFSTILSHLLKPALHRSNFKTENAKLLDDFYHRRFFSVFLKWGLGCILSLLLINAFAFNYYYQKTLKTQEIITVRSKDKAQLRVMQEQLRLKRDRVAAIWASSSSKSAFYIDNITIGMPLSVILDALVYQPVQKKIQQAAEIAVERNVIIVSGVSKDNTAFSDWVAHMEKQPWITDIKIQEYNSADGVTASFTLKILLNDA